MGVLMTGGPCCGTSLRYLKNRLRRLMIIKGIGSCLFQHNIYTETQSSTARLMVSMEAMSHPVTKATVPPRKHVIVSLSENIHTNLALEDWLYENTDLDSQSYLLLWRNEPAIVIGRHQNPWLECNVPEARRRGVPLVRRKSGGGTVYHDRGNMNCSILTNRKLYNRKQNLEMIVNAVQTKWDIPLTVNSRDDILLDGLYKVSGTAAKLGGKRAYHHFTLLFDADLSQIQNLLHSHMIGANTKATASVSAPVKNLAEADDSITFEWLTRAIADKYLNGGESEEEQRCQVRYVRPSETDFPGLDGKISQFHQWDWTYGKTPKFSIWRQFVLGRGDIVDSKSNTPLFDEGTPEHVINKEITLQVEISTDKGLVTDVDLAVTGISDVNTQQILGRFKDCLFGKALDVATLAYCFDGFDSIVFADHTICLWINDCIKKTLQFC